MNYIIFDLEGTCFPRNNTPSNFIPEIIEIGAVKLYPDLKTTEVFDSFIRPVKNWKLTEYCTNLTSIKQSDVDTARKFPDVYREFRKWCGDDVKFCSWGFYDINQIKKDCILHGIENECIDPSTHISLKHQFSESRGRRKGYGLKKALALLGEEFYGTPHRGIDDAINLTKIFIREFGRWKL